MSDQRRSSTPRPCRPSTSQAPSQRPPKKKVEDTFSLSKFEKDCVDEHNRLRTLHGCPPLNLKRDLCKYATEWAEHLLLENLMEHRPDQKYGENIFRSSGYCAIGVLPVQKWYDEIKLYDFDKPVFKPEVGHFTQLIWKESKDMGVGVARTADSVVVVVNYDPPGNVLDKFVQNVPKAIST